MDRRGFLKSMLCTAAAAVAPAPAMRTAAKVVMGIDPGIGDDVTQVAVLRADGSGQLYDDDAGVLTLEMIREAVRVLREQAVPAPDGYHVVMHPSHVDDLVNDDWPDRWCDGWLWAEDGPDCGVCDA